jgi:hypothetical protein
MKAMKLRERAGAFAHVLNNLRKLCLCLLIYGELVGAERHFLVDFSQLFRYRHECAPISQWNRDASLM